MDLLNILFELLITAIALCGLLIHSGIFRKALRTDMFYYYTNLSNLLVLIYFLLRSVGRAAGWNAGWLYSDVSFFAVTMSILLTFLIFHFLLAPNMKKQSEDNAEFHYLTSIDNYIVHYAVPLMTFADWVIFGKTHPLSYSCAITWTVIPLIYTVFSLIRGSIGKEIPGSSSRFPYYFIDPDKQGWKRVCINVVIILFLFILIGLLLLWLHKQIG